MTDKTDKGLFRCVKYEAFSSKHVMPMMFKKSKHVSHNLKSAQEYILTHTSKCDS